MPAPIAFVVMPFNEKATGSINQDAPTTVDFDALWDRVYGKVLTDLGYSAIRADSDIGALIVTDMVQRLALADLVLADITLANANVYYEVGVRHAAKRQGCVLVAADWAQPVFDLAQIRHLRFPLRDGKVGAAAAAAARAVLRSGLTELALGVSPVFDAVPGYPGEPDLDRVSAFRRDVAQLSEFQADIRAVRAAPVRQRPALVRVLLTTHGDRRVVRESVVLALLRLIRDHLGWPEVLDYIAKLPPHLATNPLIREQHALALGKTGDAVGAVGQLEALIRAEGETAERWGLLGGRYKELAEAAGLDTVEGRRYRNRAIDSYERGMLIDLNGYYSSSNLARLYRGRGDPGDTQRADETLVVTALACRSAIARGTADEWVRPTLLGNAFDRGDVAEAIGLRAQVENEGPDAWKLRTTLRDLHFTVEQHADDSVRAGLAAVLADLEALLTP